MDRVNPPRQIYQRHQGGVKLALEKSKLIVEIEATGEKAPKVLAKISDSIKDIEKNQKSLARTTSKSSEAIEKERKRYESLGKMLEKNNVNINKLNQSMEHMNSMTGGSVKSSAKLNNEMANSSKKVQSLNKNLIQLDKQYGSLNKSTSEFGDSVIEATFGVVAMGSAIVVTSMAISSLIVGLQRASMVTGKFIKTTKMIMPVLNALDNALIQTLAHLVSLRVFFGRASTAGAQQVGILQRVFLNLQYTTEQVFKSVSKNLKISVLAFQFWGKTAGFAVSQSLFTMREGFQITEVFFKLSVQSMKNTFMSLAASAKEAFQSASIVIREAVKIWVRGSTAGAKQVDVWSRALLELKFIAGKINPSLKTLTAQMKTLRKTIGVPIKFESIDELKRSMETLKGFKMPFPKDLKGALIAQRAFREYYKTITDGARFTRRALLKEQPEYREIFKKIDDALMPGARRFRKNFIITMSETLDSDNLKGGLLRFKKEYNRLFLSAFEINPSILRQRMDNLLLIAADIQAKAIKGKLPGLEKQANKIFDLMGGGTNRTKKLFDGLAPNDARQRTIIRVYQSIEESMLKLINRVEQLGPSIFKARTVGAKHVGMLRQAFLELQFSVERIGKSFVDFGTSSMAAFKKMAATWSSGIKEIFVPPKIDRTLDPFSRLIKKYEDGVIDLRKLSVMAQKEMRPFDQIMEELKAGTLEKRFFLLKKQIRNIFNSMIVSSKKFVSDFINSFKQIAVGSTAGAKHIDIFRKVLLNLQYQLENLGKILKSFAVSLGEGVKAGSKAFSQSMKAIGLDFKNLAAFGKEFAIGFKDGFLSPLRAAGKVMADLGPVAKGATSSMKGFATFLKTVFAPSVVTATKAGTALGPVVASLGIAALESENGFVKLAGVIMFVVAAAFITLGTIITLLLDKIGRLVEAMGDTLINAMKEFEKQAKKNEVVLRAFEFTLRGFNRVLGVETVGSIEHWNEAVAEMGRVTSFSVNEVRKSIKLLVAEGTSLHLNVSDMDKLLKRSADIAASTGKELSDVIQRIISGLQGQSQSVLALGMNLNEHALANSKFLKEQGKVISSLTEEEKIRLRLAEVFAQSAPVVGAAVDQLSTLQGATDQYNNTIKDIQIALGEQSTATVAYTKSLMLLNRVFLELPKPIISLVGILLDLAGVMLKVFGIFMQYFLLISSVIHISRALNTVLAANGVAANTLGKGFAWMAGKLAVYDSAIKGSIIASTSMGAVFKNLVNIIKAGMIATLKEMIIIFVDVKTKMIEFTMALVKNPLFVKGLGVVAALTAAYYILSLFRDEIDDLLKIMPMWSKVLVTILAGVVALNYALKIQALRAIILNKNVRLLIASLKIQAVVTYGSATAMNIFAISIANVATMLMIKLKAAIKAVVVWLGILNKAILMNPLFWAAVAIAAGIAAIAVAVSELTDDVKKLSKATEENSKAIDLSKNEIGFWKASWLSIKDAIRAVWQILVDFTKIAMVGWILVIKKAHVTWLKMKAIFHDVEGFRKIKKEIQGIEKEMKILKGAGMIAFGSLADNALGAKVAFAEVKDELEATGKAFDKLKNKTQIMKEAKIEVMGNEFEKAQLNLKKVNEEFSKLQSQLKKGMLLSGEQADKFGELYKKKTVAQFKLQKLISDNMTDFANKDQQNTIDKLRAQGKLAKAAQMEGNIRLKAFRDQANAMKHTGQLTDKQKVKILNMYQALKKVVGAQVELAKQAEKQKLYGNLLEDLKKLNEQTNKLNNDINSHNKSALKAVEERRKANLKEISLLEERLRLTGQLAGREGDIAAARAAVEGKAGIERQEETKKTAGNVGQVLGDVGKYAADFGELAGGAMGDVLGSVGSELMAMAGSTAAGIAGLILKLPDIFNMVSGLINEITTWPTRMGDAVRGLTQALQSFLMDFPENLMKFADDFPDILFRFIDYLIDNIDVIVERWVRAFFLFIPKLAQRFAEAAFKITAKLLKNFFVAIFEMLGVSIGDMFDEKSKKMAEGIEKGFRRAAQDAQDMGSELFKISDLNARGAIAAERQNAIEGIKQAVDESINLLALWWKKFLSWLDAQWTSLLKGLTEAWQWIYEKIITPILQGFNKIVEGMAAAFQFVYDNVIVPLGKLIDSFMGALKDFGPALQEFIGGFTETFKKFGTSIWDGLREGIEGAAETFKGIGGKIWEGLKNGIQSITDGIVKVFDDLNPSNLFSKIFAVDKMGTGTVEQTLGIDVPFMNFAKGTDARGYVKGSAKVPGDSIANDTVLSLISPGEVVIPRSIAQDPMAQRVIDKLMKGELNNFYKVSVSTKGVSVSGSPDVSTPNVSVPTINDIKKMSVQDVKDFVKNLDPTSLWGQVKEKVFKDMFWSMIDRNKFQNGGLVNGVGGTVEHGEFVINRQATQGFGIGGLNAINAGKGGGTTTNNFNVNVEVNTTEQVDDEFIRNRIGPVFKEMLRRDSLDGQRIIENTGVG